MKLIFIIGVALAGAGCSSSSSSASSPAEIDGEKAKSQALTVVPGAAGQPEKIDTEDEHRWAVPITIGGGAVVNVEITRSTGVVEEIAGEEGPFDYDLPALGAGAVTFAEAKTKALAAKTGTIEVWEFKPPASIFEFYVRDPEQRLWELKLAGNTGELTSAIEKDKPD